MVINGQIIKGDSRNFLCPLGEKILEVTCEQIVSKNEFEILKLLKVLKI